MAADFSLARFRRGLAGCLCILLAIASFGLSGCSLDRFKKESAQVPRIVIAASTDPKTFNSALNQSFPSVFFFIYDPMVERSLETNEIEPVIAESWDISDDNLTITFTLRENLKWSDGEPLTADDVVFTFNDIYLNEAIPAPTRDILRIGQSETFPSVRKIDDRRVEFTIQEPFAPFLEYVGGSTILPKHVLETAVKNTDSQGQSLFLSTWGTDTDPRTIVGNGPYRMVSYTPAERLVFERNPYYWRKGPSGEALPYVEQLIWQIVEGPDTALLQFRSGGVDSLGVSPQNFMLLKREEERGNFTIHEGGPDTGTFFVCFNLNQGTRNGQPLINPNKTRWFNTLEFRQAVAHAINRPKMINNVFLGIGEPLNSPLPKQSPYYLSPEEGLPVYDYDLDRARELLLSAGFQYNPQGQLLDSEGNLVRFTMLTNTGGRVADTIGPQIKEDLAEIGMQVDFQAVEFNTLLDRLRNSMDWDSYIGGITGGLEPHGYSTIWALDGMLHTFNRQPQEGQQPIEGQVFADWEREIAQLFVQGSQELDEDRRKEIYGRAQILIQENLPFIYLINPLVMGAVRNTIEGVQYSAIPSWPSLWNIYELQIVQDGTAQAEPVP
jgi:peptide/nickel transport system substrate-binding protein